METKKQSVLLVGCFHIVATSLAPAELQGKQASAAQFLSGFRSGTVLVSGNEQEDLVQDRYIPVDFVDLESKLKEIHVDNERRRWILSKVVASTRMVDTWRWSSRVIFGTCTYRQQIPGPAGTILQKQS